MTIPFARGKRAFGFCDRCGFRYDLGELQFQPIKARNTNLKVCPTCLDEDNPQLLLGMFPIQDPQALRDPRPDTAKVASEALFGWIQVVGMAAEFGNVTGIVGNNAVFMTGEIGTVFIEIDGEYSPNI
jgi:hypothetical protein